MPVTAPRLKRCRCDSGSRESFNPLAGLFSEHVAPEMLYLETKWASLIPFGVTVDLLKDVLPVATTLNAPTVRNHLHRVATAWKRSSRTSESLSSRAAHRTMPIAGARRAGRRRD